MEYRGDADISRSRVRYGGGSGGRGGRGGKVAVGGGLGGILVLLLALFFGSDIGDLLGTAQQPQPQQ